MYGYGYGYYGFDWTYILLIIGILGPMPGYSYEELRSMGYSDYEARKLILITNGSMTAI